MKVIISIFIFLAIVLTSWAPIYKRFPCVKITEENRGTTATLYYYWKEVK